MPIITAVKRNNRGRAGMAYDQDSTFWDTTTHYFEECFKRVPIEGETIEGLLE